MKATVSRAENGYVVYPHPDETDPAAIQPMPIVVAETYSADDLGAAKAAREMLYELLDLVGYVGSKHSSHRVRITVVNKDGEAVDY